MNVDIRKYYKPVQPGVPHPVSSVIYKEFLPHRQLQSCIYCYWLLKTSYPLTEPFQYRVVADGCTDIFFDCHDPDENYVMGFCPQYTQFALGHSFHYMGVRFLPGMFAPLFRIDAAMLTNRCERTDVVIPSLAKYISQSLEAHPNYHQITTLLDRFFLDLLSKTKMNSDVRFERALEMIVRNHGVLSTESDLDTGISQRQLRRLFEARVGGSPKRFSKVVRFQNILRQDPSLQSIRQTKLFYDAGYYDQSHFIKEFRELYGITPGKVVAQ